MFTTGCHLVCIRIESSPVLFFEDPFQFSPSLNFVSQVVSSFMFIQTKILYAFLISSVHVLSPAPSDSEILCH